MESHGLLVEGFHVGQTSLHLGLDVALVSAGEPDASDALEWPQKVVWNDEIGSQQVIHTQFFLVHFKLGKTTKISDVCVLICKKNAKTFEFL